jgi:kinesin family protein 15
MMKKLTVLRNAKRDSPSSVNPKSTQKHRFTPFKDKENKPPKPPSNPLKRKLHFPPDDTVSTSSDSGVKVFVSLFSSSTFIRVFNLINFEFEFDFILYLTFQVVVRLKPICNDKDEGDSVIQKISSDSLQINGHDFIFDSVAHMDSTQA